MENKRLTHDQAAFILQVSRQTIYNMQERDTLPQVIDDMAVVRYITEEQSRVDKMRERLRFVQEQ